MRPVTILAAVALAATLAGCAGSAPPTTPAAPALPGSQASAVQALAPTERVDYAEACPDLVRHGRAGVDLITEFLADPQAMANKKTQTTTRFDEVINQLTRDARIAPLPLVTSIETQQSQLRELRDFAMTGGTRQIDLNEYKLAAGQTVLKCGGEMPSSPTSTPPPGPADTISEGTHVVGTDIQPGTYKTTGGGSCYWARLKDTTGDSGTILANGLGDGPATVTIKESDGAFETHRCALWAKVS